MNFLDGTAPKTKPKFNYTCLILNVDFGESTNTTKLLFVVITKLIELNATTLCNKLVGYLASISAIGVSKLNVDKIAVLVAPILACAIMGIRSRATANSVGGTSRSGN